MAIQLPQDTDLLSVPDHSLSHRVFANDNAAPEQSVVVDASGNTILGGTLTADNMTTATQKSSGIHRSTALTYISGTGTAGVDNTAAVLYTSVLLANSLTQIGDRIRVRAYWAGTTGSAITGSAYIGPSGFEVLVGDTTDSGAASLQIVESWLHYIDNTHANIIEQEGGALGTISAPNVAGFTWNTDQHIEFRQNQVGNNHCILYALIIDIFPKGIV